jgi:hypothetical protein
VSVWPGWERDVLTALKAPINADTTKFMDEWHAFEGGSALNNPLNTTQPELGATNYNSVGVKNYPSSAVGTKATVTTLENGRYPDIIGALRSGVPFTYGNKGAVSSQIQTWGSFNFANWYMQQGIAAQPGVPAETAPSGTMGTQSMTAWHVLSLTLGREVPQSLQHSQKARAAALHKLH